jgi:hypothetical protein
MPGIVRSMTILGRRVLQLAWRLPTRRRRAVGLPVTGPSTPYALGSGFAGMGRGEAPIGQMFDQDAAFSFCV